MRKEDQSELFGTNGLWYIASKAAASPKAVYLNPPESKTPTLCKCNDKGLNQDHGSSANQDRLTSSPSCCFADLSD